MGLLLANSCAVGVCGIQLEHCGYQFSPTMVLVKMTQGSNALEECYLLGIGVR